MRLPPLSALVIIRAALALSLLIAMAPAKAALVETIERVKPAIVAVGTYQKDRSPPFVFRGTGFAVGDGLLVATAAHLVPEAQQMQASETMMVLVGTAKEREQAGHEARTVAIDRIHDVALLRITEPPLTPLKLGDSNAVRDGTSIAFTGFPIGQALGYSPVTHRGIISAQPPLAVPSPGAKYLDSSVIRSLNSGVFRVFQLDATAYPGHSGSPLYDAETGEVIGIINMSLKATKDAAVGQATGISVAVPIQYLHDLLRGLR